MSDTRIIAEQSQPPGSASVTGPGGSPPAGVGSHLGLWDAVAIIVGIVIGAGIYETAPLIFRCVSSPGEAMRVWTLGGLLSVVGALCYAELATTYPRLGGDYYFLRRAYGSWAGFLFGWAQLTVIMTGSIGMMAYVFADYAVKLTGTGGRATPAFAAGAVIGLSLANLVGLKSGRRTQNVLTLLKVIGLSLIIAAGLFWPVHSPTITPVAGGGGSSVGLAMILVLYTYGGWNDAAFVVAEMKDKSRNIPRALLFGTAGVAVIYLLINISYVSALGFAGARNSQAIAADVLRGAFGDAGAGLMSLLVVISALGALNGLILTGARVSAAMGADFSFLSPLARWHRRLGTPVWSLLAQLGIALAMILLVGTPAGQALIDRGFRLTGLAAFAWEGHGGFDTLLRATAPVFWLFFLLTGLSLFVLRVRDRQRERPFSVPLYPVLPVVFCSMCGYLLYSAAMYAGRLTLLGVAPLVVGGVVLASFPQRGKQQTGSTPEP